MDVAQLLDLATSGDQQALKSLLERFGPQVWGEMRAKIGRQRQRVLDADDVMQVTYLEAFLQIERLTTRDEGGFLAWLRRIADNNLRDACRELDRKKRPPISRLVQPNSEESCVALIDLLGATSHTPSRAAAGSEAAAMLHRGLERLPPDYATVVRLYDLEGREIDDVAQRMSRSPGAVHMLRARAHDRLRATLGGESQFFSDPGR